MKSSGPGKNLIKAFSLSGNENGEGANAIGRMAKRVINRRGTRERRIPWEFMRMSTADERRYAKRLGVSRPLPSSPSRKWRRRHRKLITGVVEGVVVHKQRRTRAKMGQNKIPFK